MKTLLQSRVADATEISSSELFVSQSFSFFASYHQNASLEQIATEDLSKTPNSKTASLRAVAQSKCTFQRSLHFERAIQRSLF